MRIEHGIYYTEEELNISNVNEVVKNGFEEALQLAVDGKVKGFVAEGFGKKYGWNGSTYYELINLDYQDLSEYNPAEEQAELDAAADMDALRTELDALQNEVEKLKPLADKYNDYADVIDLFEKMKGTSEEQLMAEIDRFKQIFSEIAADAQAILSKIE